MNDQVVMDIRTLINRSGIDYFQAYMQLFAAYNLWFRSVTGVSVERRALRLLRQRGEIWTDILRGNVAPGMRSHLIRLYVLTQHRPMTATRAWSGRLRDTADWTGLLEFWYAVRCDVVHGTEALRSPFYAMYIKLAYETLYLFMGEIMRRMSLASSSQLVTIPPYHRLDTASYDRVPHFIQK